MFEVGTKIQLVSSSFKKSTGPRRGSLGYVANLMDNAVLEQLSIHVCFAEVIFYRYGFEKRTRLEKKQVVLVFPIINRKLEGDIHQQVDSILNKVSGRNGDYADQIRNYFGYGGEIAVVAASQVLFSECSLLNCDKNEFRAWVEALISSSEFRMFLHESLHSKHYTNANIGMLQKGNNWHTLQTMTMDKSAKRQQLDEWLSMEAIRENAITTIKSMLVVMGRVNSRAKVGQVLAKCSMNMPSSKNISMSAAYDSFSDCLQIKHIMSSAADVVKSLKSKSLLETIEDINAVRGELGVLSASFERENFTAVQ